MARKFDAYYQGIMDDAGMYVNTWSPGDGQTRYRFTFDPRDTYYGPGSGISTSLGYGEACSFLRGVRAGIEACSRAVPGERFTTPILTNSGAIARVEW